MFDRCHTSATRRIRRAYVRVYIDRLRRALERASDEARLVVDPGEVLVAEETPQMRLPAGYAELSTGST
jgi:hypothetical protein